MLALRHKNAILSNGYYMTGVTVCQAKCDINSKAVGDAIVTVVAVNSKPAHAKPACAAVKPRLAGMGEPDA